MRLLLRVLFYCSLLVITYLAFAPVDEQLVSTGWDKANHVLAFFVLLALLDMAYPQVVLSLWKLGLLLGYGALIEAGQYFMPERELSLLDLLSDGLGLVMYLLLRPAIWRISLRLGVDLPADIAAGK